MSRAPWLPLLALAAAQGLAAQQIMALAVHPPLLRVDAATDRPQCTVVATDDAGFDLDVTALATFTLANPALGTLERRGDAVLLAGTADGETELVVEHAGKTARVPVQVHGAATTPPPSFRLDVLPVLTHAGCNAGSCHGAAIGKNGFGLSLFAYDPTADLRTLTRDLRGRRLDVARPELSLFLQKATGSVPHQGGKRLAPDSEEYRRVLAWVRGGAAADAERTPALQRLTVHPGEALLLPGRTLGLRVVAHYDDGSDRDVTALSLWSSNDDAAATVGKDGRIAAVGRGEAVLLARFGGSAAIAHVQVLPDAQPWTWPETPERNFVDAQVHHKLRAARVAPAPVCSDEVFVRRVHLDLVGTLPTPAVVRAFLADERTDKRDRLIDELLQSPGFADVQAMSWAEVLRVDAERMEAKGAALLTSWLREAFAAGRPFDQIVTELLTADGPTFTNAPANFWLANDQPHLLGEHVAQDFLGLRLQCAQCHNHPFENWSMDDYYGFAAFFGQIGKKRAEDGAEWIVWDRRSGDVRHKRTEAITAPRFLGGKPATIPAGTDRRRVLAQWLVAADNPWFARNVANRAWARLFGRGLVEPVDDVRIGNPASHPQLLQELADLLVREKFDVRALFRTIARSRSYQLARHPDAPPPALFAGNQVRRLSAEQLLDAIGAATEVPTKYPGLPLGAPATAIASGRTDVRFLDVFGRPARESACTCDRRQEPTLGQTLHLINGDTIATKIANERGRLRRLLAAGTPAPEVLDELFLAAYARLPRADERAHLLDVVGDGKDAAATTSAWQDVFWAMLNSHEFLFQH